jgi:hypothetical protein
LAKTVIDMMPVLKVLECPQEDGVLELAVSCVRFFVNSQPEAASALVKAGIARRIAWILETATFEQAGRCVSAIHSILMAAGAEACEAFYSEAVVRGLAEYLTGDDRTDPKRFNHAIEVIAYLAEFGAARTGGIKIAKIVAECGADAVLYAASDDSVNAGAARRFCELFLDTRG